MNLPTIISKSVLFSLAAPDETHAVRILLHDVNNQSQYRLSCRSRTYLFEKCGIVGRHLLEIPVSLWMQDSPTKSFRENQSISEDFRSADNCPYSIQIVPWKGAAPQTFGQAMEAHFLPLLREILRTIEAPPVVEEAFKLIDAGNLGELQDLAAFLKSAAKTDGPSPAAAERARKMREAKAAKKAQLQTA
ncbi:MAG: hypothetical protein RLZZ214_1346 [Verrucomicrobiota bacterium]|jgi:hypothetical protein